MRTTQGGQSSVVTSCESITRSTVSYLSRNFRDTVAIVILPGGLQECFEASGRVRELGGRLGQHSSVVKVFPGRRSLVELVNSILLREGSTIVTGGTVFDPTGCALVSGSGAITRLEGLTRRRRGLETT